jgi:hypothetical protein
VDVEVGTGVNVGGAACGLHALMSTIAARNSTGIGRYLFWNIFS